MEQTIKCLILKNNCILISEISEVSAEMGEPNCRLINPFQILSEDEFVPWPSVTDQYEIMLHSDNILTIVEPKPKLYKKYLELIER